MLWDEIPLLSAAGLLDHGITIQSPTGLDAQAGITGALAGIAETGTLVLSEGEGQALRASLVPEIHIAVLQVSQLVQTLEGALQQPEVSAAAASVLISGPSRTADIEMTLTIGVHGPRELHVFLVDGTERK